MLKWSRKSLLLFLSVFLCVKKSFQLWNFQVYNLLIIQRRYMTVVIFTTNYTHWILRACRNWILFSQLFTNVFITLSCSKGKEKKLKKIKNKCEFNWKFLMSLLSLCEWYLSTQYCWFNEEFLSLESSMNAFRSTNILYKWEKNIQLYEKYVINFQHRSGWCFFSG